MYISTKDAAMNMIKNPAAKIGHSLVTFKDNSRQTNPAFEGEKLIDKIVYQKTKSKLAFSQDRKKPELSKAFRTDDCCKKCDIR